MARWLVYDEFPECIDDISLAPGRNEPEMCVGSAIHWLQGQSAKYEGGFISKKECGYLLLLADQGV